MVWILAVALLAWALAYSQVPLRLPQRALRPKRLKHGAVDLVGFIAEVSARLRAGAGEDEAWARTATRWGLDPGLGEDGPRALVEMTAGTHGPARGALSAARLSRELGAPLADLLDHYGEILAQTQAAADSAAVALAGPRTSARLLAALPLLGIAIGAAMGVDPASALLDGGLGTLAGSAGAILIVVGYGWSRVLIEKALRVVALDEAIDAHLVAGALETGASIPRALSAVGKAGRQDELVEVGTLLRLGARWEEAWRTPGLISRTIEPAWIDGANPVPLLTAAARAAVASSDRLAREAAQRLAVRLVVPLGLCYLPAFVLLSVVPVVVSLGGGLL